MSDEQDSPGNISADEYQRALDSMPRCGAAGRPADRGGPCVLPDQHSGDHQDADGWSWTSTLASDLRRLLNLHSRENRSGTPDYILAGYVLASLEVFENTVVARDQWWGFEPKIGGIIPAVTPEVPGDAPMPRCLALYPGPYTAQCERDAQHGGAHQYGADNWVTS